MDKLLNIFNSICYRSFTISSKTDDIVDEENCIPYGRRFDALYVELNNAKHIMDKMPHNNLMLLRKLLYPYSKLPSRLSIKYVTNAWLKTYEMLLVENIVHKTNKYLAFFNANAPGTSSMAFEYYMKLHHNNIEYDWVASSLIGTGALTDTYGIIRETADKWMMDSNNNGDVTNVNNILDFVDKIQKKFRRKVDFYFSDIGKETSDYDHEEHNEVKEVYSQNIIALMTLKRGGTMITKQRNFMTPFNLSMISFFATLFTEFKIVKPETSRQINSEIYLVGKNFLGITEDHERNIIYVLNNFSNTTTDGEFAFTPMSIPFGISRQAAKHMLDAAYGITRDDQIRFLHVMADLNKTQDLQQLYKQIAPRVTLAETDIIKRFQIKNI